MLRIVELLLGGAIKRVRGLSEWCSTQRLGACVGSLVRIKIGIYDGGEAGLTTTDIELAGGARIIGPRTVGVRQWSGAELQYRRLGGEGGRQLVTDWSVSIRLSVV